MKQAVILFSVLFTIPFFMTGCQNSSVGTDLSGDIIGYAHLYDVNGIHAVADSGITVSIEENGMHVTTAVDGRFVFSGVPTGTYTIDLSKTGYGTFKRPGTLVVGGGPIYLGGSLGIFQLPSYSITSLLAAPTATNVALTGTFVGSLPTGAKHQRIFIGTTSAVSSDPANYLFSTTAGSAASLSTTIDSATFHSSGIAAGSTAYIVAYAEGAGGFSYSYVDFATGRTVYPDLNTTASNVVTVIVP